MPIVVMFIRESWKKVQATASEPFFTISHVLASLGKYLKIDSIETKELYHSKSSEIDSDAVESSAYQI